VVSTRSVAKREAAGGVDRGADGGSQRQRFSTGPAQAPSALADGQQQSEDVRIIERGVSSELEANAANTTATTLSASSDRVGCLHCLAPKGVVLASAGNVVACGSDRLLVGTRLDSWDRLVVALFAER
jgi:hypothetical protein